VQVVPITALAEINDSYGPDHISRYNGFPTGRLRPILMTSIAVLIGITFFGLFLTAVFYFLLLKWGEKRRKKAAAHGEWRSLSSRSRFHGEAPKERLCGNGRSNADGLIDGVLLTGQASRRSCPLDLAPDCPNISSRSKSLMPSHIGR
jgi:hypothetical protein